MAGDAVDAPAERASLCADDAVAGAEEAASTALLAAAAFVGVAAVAAAARNSFPSMSANGLLVAALICVRILLCSACEWERKRGGAEVERRPRLDAMTATAGVVGE